MESKSLTTLILNISKSTTKVRIWSRLKSSICLPALKSGCEKMLLLRIDWSATKVRFSILRVKMCIFFLTCFQTRKGRVSCFVGLFGEYEYPHFRLNQAYEIIKKLNKVIVVWGLSFNCNFVRNQSIFRQSRCLLNCGKMRIRPTWLLSTIFTFRLKVWCQNITFRLWIENFWKSVFVSYSIGLPSA